MTHLKREIKSMILRNNSNSRI